MYLSIIKIKNFKGIKELEVKFNSKLNIIIGENGCKKTALIDAIRLLYNLGNTKKDIYVSNEDFYIDNQTLIQSNYIEISYFFPGLSEYEKGALYEYIVLTDGSEEDYAQITLRYEYRKDNYPKFSYYTGATEEQRAESGTFEIFQHYFLGALRDSTVDLLNVKNNILGSVIKRLVERANSQEQLKDIVKKANEALLSRPEVKDTRDSVNSNLDEILKITNNNKIGLRIEEASKIESIVNIIKPYLPFDKENLINQGLNLWQNSLGFNNLIYIATILGDIKERLADNKNQHYALLIEEPEAHLHPQLQLNLYNFLKQANNPPNCQLFITSHSPTLTSKVNLDSLILLQENAIRIGDCFNDREKEKIVEKIKGRKVLTDSDFKLKKAQLERYLDVTKSQLFFARAVLYVEGISEELLISAFAEKLKLKLENYQAEIINVSGTSFYPFIYLSNSKDNSKNIKQPIVIITDDDRYTKSKDKNYSFKNLVRKNYEKLNILHEKIEESSIHPRIGNLRSTIRNSPNKIKLFTAYKTLEYEIALSNIGNSKIGFDDNLLISFLKSFDKAKYQNIIQYIATLPNEELSLKEKEKIAILVWKALPPKTEFAQDFSFILSNKLNNNEDVKFIVPPYLKKAIKFVTNIKQ